MLSTSTKAVSSAMSIPTSCQRCHEVDGAQYGHDPYEEEPNPELISELFRWFEQQMKHKAGLFTSVEAKVYCSTLLVEMRVRLRWSLLLFTFQLSGGRYFQSNNLGFGLSATGRRDAHRSSLSSGHTTV